MIACIDPKAQYLAYQKEIDAAIAGVLKEGHYILGEQVKLFEQKFAAYIGVGYGIGVGSGTAAIHLALKAFGIGAGDEVITVSYTAVATVAAICAAGATPVLVDIDPTFYVMDPAGIEAAISSRTKAIVAVHLYGQTVDMDAVMDIARRHQLKVVEDCAQCHGALYKGKKAGAFGDAACFSFYPTKNLGAIGDGGMIVTSNGALADSCRQLREYGWDKKRCSQIPGWNSRLDELQAAILDVKLKYLDEDNEYRRNIAARYDAGLKGLPVQLPKVRDGATHVYHLYVVQVEQRDVVQARLRERGIIAMVHYPYAVHQQPGFAELCRVPALLRNTEVVLGKILTLPNYPGLSFLDQDVVLKALVELLGSGKKKDEFL